MLTDFGQTYVLQIVEALACLPRIASTFTSYFAPMGNDCSPRACCKRTEFYFPAPSVTANRGGQDSAALERC
eukprot:6209633-Pleurochrysis_carterae.AAC.3